MIPVFSSPITNQTLYEYCSPRTPQSRYDSSPALRGALLAFGSTPPPLKSPTNTYSGTNGALAAATKADSAGRKHFADNTPAQPQSGAGRIHYLNGPLTAAQLSMMEAKERRIASEFGSPKVSPYNDPNTSNLAAIRASRRHSQHSSYERNPSVRLSRDELSVTDQGDGASELPRVGLVGDARKRFMNGGTGVATQAEHGSTFRKSLPEDAQAAHIVPTASLIQAFEKASLESQDSSRVLNRTPDMTISRPAILSPRPLRPLRFPSGTVGANLAPAGRASSDQKLPSNKKSNPSTQPSASVASPSQVLTDGHAQTVTKRNDGGGLASVTSGRVPPQPPPPRKPRLLPKSPPQVATRPHSALQNRLDLPVSKNEELASISRKHNTGGSFNTGFPTIAITAGSVAGTQLPGHTSPPGLSRRVQPLRSRTPVSMTENDLANAMVASSLATIRVPTPSSTTGPPLPKRHPKPHHSLFHKHNLRSQTPSPPKGMRQTMRRIPVTDDEGDSEFGARRRRHLIKKHPNKHHEGARKRWRDAITERERKRYEGVWAANRGLHLLLNGPQISSTVAQGSVLNLVVRDIWSRSRLANNVLEEVWDLVDRRGVGLLDREEFVVGMWLIDQRLKGRKLPIKVSASVWDSVRALGGIKIPKSKR